MYRFRVPLFVTILYVCHPLSIHAQAGNVSQNLPIVFEANRGQVSANYEYHFHRDGVDTLFTRNGMDVVLHGNNENPLHIEFVDGDAAPKGARPLTGHTNYFLGSDTSRWIRNVPLFSEVDYTDLYRGISLFPAVRRAPETAADLHPRPHTARRLATTR